MLMMLRQSMFKEITWKHIMFMIQNQMNLSGNMK